MKSINKWLLLIVTLNVVLRFTVIGYLKEYKNPETWEYGRVAENIVAGNGFSW